MRITDWIRRRRERKAAELVELVEKKKQARDAAPGKQYYLTEESPHQRAVDQTILSYFPSEDDRE